MFIRLLVAAAILMVAGSAHADETEYSNTFTYSLLTDETPGLVTISAKTIARGKLFTQSTTDLVAELLSERADKHAITRADLDATCWLIRILGLSGNVRYKAVIENAMSAFADEKVTKFGNVALAKLINPADSLYVAGTISLEQLRRNLATKRAAITSRTRSFESVITDRPIDEIFTALGYPDAILETTERNGFLYLKIRSRSLQFNYYGLGIVDMDYSTSPELHGWRVTGLWYDVPNDSPRYTGNKPLDASLVMTTEPMQLQKLSLRLVAEHVTEVELLDRVAERIRISLKSYQAHEVYALSYFCRLLGESGNMRYKDILQLAADEAADAETRGHAKDALKKLRKS